MFFRHLSKPNQESELSVKIISQILLGRLSEAAAFLNLLLSVFDRLSSEMKQRPLAILDL